MSVLALVTAGCGGSDESSTPITPASAAPTTATPATSSTAPTTTSPPRNGPIHIVGLGDSVMYTGTEQHRSIIDVFAEQLTVQGLASSVVVDNLADPSATSASLLDALQTDAAMGEAVAAADVVVISVGGNDSDPFAEYPAGVCAPAGDLAECLGSYAPTLGSNLNAIADAVVSLHDGSPVALRLLSPDYNPFVGWSEAPTDTFGADFYAQVAAAETEAACAAAEGHGGMCLDTFHLINGPDGVDDAAAYLAGDHAHPGEAGIVLFGQALADLGLPELDLDTAG